MILEPVRRHILLSQLDLLQSEIARLHELETHFEGTQKCNELGCVHESISNIAAVIKADVENLLRSIGGLDLSDEKVQFVLGILKSQRLRPIHLIKHRKMMTKRPT
jgi:hypothetical protein